MLGNICLYRTHTAHVHSTLPHGEIVYSSLANSYGILELTAVQQLSNAAQKVKETTKIHRRANFS